MARESGGGGTEQVIALDHVRKRFGEFVAVEDADFSIGAGEFFSLLGPSGCGKTTTLRMIAGFEQPSAGRVLLDGRDVSRVPPYRRGVNTVFQQYALFPHMTVYDNVAFGPRSQRLDAAEADRRVREMLAVVRLEALGGRKPAQLSGGQQQRVALARALVNRPRALLLDEPLGALDLKLRQAMQLELKRIQGEVGIAFVHVTHDQEEALTMSDRIAVMNGGRVEQIGSPREIYSEPASVFVASFIGTANLIPARVEAVAGDGAAVTIPGGLRIPVGAGAWVPRPDEAVVVAVRPERVRVTAELPAGGVAVPVTVAASIFQGAVLRLELRAADGTEIVAHVAADAAGQTPPPGAAAWVAWDASAARLLPP